MHKGNSSLRKKYNSRHIGIGGWNCNCCSPTKKNRNFYKRIIKRIEEREEMKLEMEQSDSCE